MDVCMYHHIYATIPLNNTIFQYQTTHPLRYQVEVVGIKYTKYIDVLGVWG